MIVSGEVDWRESDAQLCAAWQAAADMVEAGWTLPDSRTADTAAAGAEPDGSDSESVRTPEQMSDGVCPVRALRRGRGMPGRAALR